MNGLHGYPRPQLERAEWFDLDGEWEFALDPEAVVTQGLFVQRLVRIPLTATRGAGFKAASR